MAQTITIANSTYPDVAAIDVPKQGGGTARFSDASVTTATSSDVKQGKIFVNAQGNQDAGTYVPTTPTGNINITQTGVTDVTNYATATVASADPWIEIEDGFFTDSGVRKFRYRGNVMVDESEGDTAGYLSDGYSKSSEWSILNVIPTNTTVTPTKSAQTIGAMGTIMEGAVTIAAVPEMDSWEGYIQRDNYETINGQRYWKPTSGIKAFNSGWIDAGTYGEVDTFPAVASSTTITPTTSAQTIGGANTMMEGAVTVAAMPSGSATPAASISGTSATVSTGTNTLTLSKTVSNTPQVSAGYVSSGTAGNSNVSLTASVTTKAAATITPGTTNQTIASGTYLTGTQTISGDANLVAGNIKNGTSIFGVTGTYSGGGGTLTVATKTATMSSVGQTLSFTNLSGTPKYWFVKTTSQISSSGSTTIYYITDGFFDGTSVKGNSFRIGSTRRIYSWTSGVTQSYSGGTLTITGGSATGSSPGQFFNGTYELTYVY